MTVHVVIMLLMQVFLQEVTGTDGTAIIEIQPKNPSVREGDDVTLNCYIGVENAPVDWHYADKSNSMFQRIERHSFPGGMSLRLLNASRLPGEDTSATSFTCAASQSSARTTVTVVPSSAPGSPQSSLVVFPVNPVAQNGSSISLTCINPPVNESDIGWYVSGEVASKFSSHEVEKFDNGAFLRITDINVEIREAEISVVCLQPGSDPSVILTEPVTIRVREMIPTTEAPEDTRDPGITHSVTVSPSTPPYRGATGTDGVSASLVLVAIAIGAGLAVFCVCLIFLSVYTLFYLRSQSLDFLSKGSEDDVFKTTDRSIDSVHPYQSVTDRVGADAAGDGLGKSGYSELNQYDVAGAAGNKAPYADLTPYAEPRVYMTLESESAKPTPAKREVTAPDGIYDSEIGTQISSFKHEDTTQV